MADNNKTFTLVGLFDDQITKKLQGINKQIEQLTKFSKVKFDAPFKSMTNGIKAASEELKQLSKGFDALSKKQFHFDKSGITAAKEEARLLGREIDDVAKKGFNFDRSGLKAAQQDASVLGDILKANALIKVGEGVGNALTSGARSSVSILGKGMGFVGKQFSAAVKDELEDMQARGSLFGSLKKSKVFSGTTAEEDTRDYRQTKRISRINEEVIGNIVRESPVSTATVSTLNRQLTDNLLPQMLKSRGITNLGTQSEAQLEQTFKGTPGKEGVGTELAKLYEQMATLMPSPQYAKMGAMGFTQALTSGTINRQLAIFEGNPVLVEALKTIDGGIAATSDIGKRVKILKKALEVAAPTMMLDEMRLSVAGGMQSIGDTLTNPNVGILSFAMEVQGQGLKSLQDFGKVNGQVVKNSAYALKLADFDKKQKERRETVLKKGGDLNALEIQQQKDKKDFIDKLDDILKNANSPLERIGVSLSPVLQSIAGMLNAMGSVFMGPVNAAMKTLDIVFAKLEINLGNIASKLRKGEYTGAEGIGRLFAEITKAIATIFDPLGLGGKAGKGIDKLFADFMKGFNSEGLNGSKYLDMVIKGVQSIIMKLLFKEGNIGKGLTPLGDGLGKIFLLLAAPAFINALIIGLVPLAVQGMGAMIFGTLKGLGPKLAADPATGARVGLGGGGGGFFSTPASAAAARRLRSGARGVAGVGMDLAGLGYGLAGRPGLRAARGIGGAARGVAGAAKGVGKFVPGGAVAFGALDAGMRIAAGEDAGSAIGKAASSTIGATLGAVLGQALIPVPGLGAVIGGIAGGMIGDKVGSAIFDSVNAQEKAAQAQAQAATVMEASNKTAAAKYTDAKSLGGVEAINRKYGGGAGLSKVLEDPAKLKEMGLTKPEDVAQAKQVAGHLTQLNNATAKTKAAQDAYSASVANNTKDQEKNKAALNAAVAQQRTLEAAMKKTWESTNLTAQQGLLRSAGALADALNAAAAKLNFPGKNLGDGTTAPGGARPGLAPAQGPANAVGGKGGRGYWAGTPGLGMDLGAAIKDEMAHKPPGSKLVIANSSETIIPAFNGLNLGGMAAGLDRFTTGANALSGLADLAGGAGGGAGGGAISGNLIEVGKKLLAMGLQVGMNSFFQYGKGFLPGGGGYIGKHSPNSLHYSNRALDVSGTTAQLDAAYAALRGSNPTELLWRTAGHYDHLHVAYARGLGNPTYFPSQSDAMMWEQKMMPPGARVQSVTSNSSENLGGTTTVNAPITIHQTPGQDAEQLASLVAMRLSEAIMQNRASAIQY